MRIELHGKVITGTGSRDEPLPAHYVLRRLLGHPATRIHTEAGGLGRGERLEVTIGPHVLTCEVRIERATPPERGWLAELQVSVTHAPEGE